MLVAHPCCGLCDVVERTKPATTIFLGGSSWPLLFLSTLFRHDSLIAINLLAQMAFLTYVIFVVVRVVFRASLVDGNILCGAASVYLMIGVLIGFIYSLIELLNPGSFTIIPAFGSNPRRALKRFTRAG